MWIQFFMLFFILCALTSTLSYSIDILWYWNFQLGIHGWDICLHLKQRSMVACRKHQPAQQSCWHGTMQGLLRCNQMQLLLVLFQIWSLRLKYFKWKLRSSVMSLEWLRGHLTFWLVKWQHFNQSKSQAATLPCSARDVTWWSRLKTSPLFLSGLCQQSPKSCSDCGLDRMLEFLLCDGASKNLKS